jgi:small neutral amino acid transporter SnatA (MarC family)
MQAHGLGGRQLRRTALFTLAILVVSFFAGREILALFDISLAVPHEAPTTTGRRSSKTLVLRVYRL